MIDRKDLRNARLLVGLKGSNLECVTPDGVVEWQLGFPAGIHETDKLTNYMQEGDQLRLSGAGSLLKTGARVLAQSFGDTEFQSGANPAFQPSIYTEAEVRMRKLIDKANKSEARLAKREQALAALSGKVSEKGEVIEPEAETPAETAETTEPAEVPNNAI